MRRAVVLSIACGVLAVLPAMQDSRPVAATDLTPEAEASIERGLVWLADAQNHDGSWGCEKGSAPSTGLTGMSGLAFLAAGCTPTEGEYHQTIQRAVDYLLRAQHRSTGQITAFDAVGFGPMYDHGYAVTFLAEVLGMMRDDPDDEDLRDRLIRAVTYVERAQNEDGGWGTQPSAGSHLPTTAVLYGALRSAANAGIPVNVATLDGVERYAHSCYQSGGTFNIGNGGWGGQTYFATGSGLRILFGVGDGATEEGRAAAEWFSDKLMGFDYGGRLSEWCFAGLMLGGHAMLQDTSGHGGRFWDIWWPRNRDHIVSKQNGDGSWTVEYCASCRVMATAICLTILQAPRRNLPMWDL